MWWTRPPSIAAGVTYVLAVILTGWLIALAGVRWWGW